MRKRRKVKARRAIPVGILDLPEAIELIIGTSEPWRTGQTDPGWRLQSLDDCKAFYQRNFALFEPAGQFCFGPGKRHWLEWLFKHGLEQEPSDQPAMLDGLNAWRPGEKQQWQLKGQTVAARAFFAADLSRPGRWPGEGRVEGSGAPNSLPGPVSSGLFTPYNLAAGRPKTGFSLPSVLYGSGIEIACRAPNFHVLQ